MPDKTCKLIELVGVSEESAHQAIRNAVARAARGLKGLDWFEVTEVPGLVREGQVSEFQVKLKVGFRTFSEDEVRGARTGRRRKRGSSVRGRLRAWTDGPR
jgi:dodecin